jgi:alpha-1,2-mannosyltransferase/arabinofuranan 3-O-arabinosyltransferase
LTGYRRAGGFVVWALAAVVLVVVAWLNYRHGVDSLNRIATGSMDVHADFETFWSSAYALLSGESVYDTGARLANLNPPLWVLLTAPLALLEPLDAYRLFTLLMLAVFVGTLSWMAGESRLGSGAAVVISVALVLSSPLMSTLGLGQMYPVLAFGLVGAWAADRRGMDGISGVFLGLVAAFKPTLALVLLWPLFRRRWGTLGAAVLSGAGATLLGFVAAGPRVTFEYARTLLGESVNGYWDNASLHSTAIRFFTENDYAENLVQLPWMVVVAQVLALGLAVLTAYLVRGGTEWGLWAVVAASLLASPVAWNNYLVLLAPAVVLLFARRRYAIGVLLIGLQFVPPRWPLFWNGDETLLATFALSLYTFVLLAHWIPLLFYGALGVPESNRDGEKYRKSGAATEA